MKSIAIVDYGMGNLGSVSNACAFLRFRAEVVVSPSGLDRHDAVILPGVGAFGDCVGHLRRHGFVDALRGWIASGRPFLGICVGLQALFESSEESPGVEGLGVLRGVVRRFRPGPERKIPQMGWNRLAIRQPACPMFEGVPDGAHVYFVHSYFPVPADASIVAAETEYGETYASAVWRGNVFAVQFHPEKSQAVGRRILLNFGRWIESFGPEGRP
jgi:glutamine amidotransferase